MPGRIYQTVVTAHKAAFVIHEGESLPGALRPACLPIGVNRLQRERPTGEQDTADGPPRQHLIVRGRQSNAAALRPTGPLRPPATERRGVRSSWDAETLPC